MNILTYDNIDRVEWSRLVETSATGTWFQSPEAYNFYDSLPELFKPFVVAVINDANGDNGDATLNGGALRGVCVGYVTVEKSAFKQFLTRRAIIIGGPCWANDATNEEVSLLLSTLRQQLSTGANAPIYIESRNFNDYSCWIDAFASAGFEYKPHLNFHVDCTDAEAMWERMSENRKRQIRRVTSEEVKELTNESLTNEGVSEQDVREWYAILKELYRTKVRTPLWPVEFFIEAYRQGVGNFLLVKHEGKVIGGSMVVEWKPSLQGGVGGRLGTVYEWFECGLNAKYKEQYPSVMATWAGLQYANEHCCSRYDMMGAGEPGVPYGVRDFKSEFGGELVEHGRFLCVCKPWLYRFGSFVVKILKGK